MTIKILITGGTFDKEYMELTGELIFKNTHIHEMLKLAKSCDAIYNDSGEDFAIEYIKEFEKNNLLVIENSLSYYEDEDKYPFEHSDVEIYDI